MSISSSCHWLPLLSNTPRKHLPVLLSNTHFTQMQKENVYKMREKYEY